MRRSNDKEMISSEAKVLDQIPKMENLVSFFALLIEVDKRNQEKLAYD